MISWLFPIILFHINNIFRFCNNLNLNIFAIFLYMIVHTKTCEHSISGRVCISEESGGFFVLLASLFLKLVKKIFSIKLTYFSTLSNINLTLSRIQYLSNLKTSELHQLNIMYAVKHLFLCQWFSCFCHYREKILNFWEIWLCKFLPSHNCHVYFYKVP